MTNQSDKLLAAAAVERLGKDTGLGSITAWVTLRIAAPDLLEALKNMTTLAQNMRDAIETGAPVQIIPNGYFNQAYNAIAKAGKN